MSISTALYALVNVTGVRSLMPDGASDVRFYPAGMLPQDNDSGNPTLPAATFQTIGGSPANVFEVAAPADNERIQVDVWALTFDAAQTAADAMRSAIEDQSAQTTQGVGAYIVSFNGHDFEPSTRRYRVSFDLSIWQSR